MILPRSPRRSRSSGFSHTDSCVVGLKKKTRSSPVHTTHLGGWRAHLGGAPGSRPKAAGLRAPLPGLPPHPPLQRRGVPTGQHADAPHPPRLPCPTLQINSARGPRDSRKHAPRRPPGGQAPASLSGGHWRLLVPPSARGIFPLVPVNERKDALRRRHDTGGLCNPAVPDLGPSAVRSPRGTHSSESRWRRVQRCLHDLGPQGGLAPGQGRVTAPKGREESQPPTSTTTSFESEEGWTSLGTYEVPPGSRVTAANCARLPPGSQGPSICAVGCVCVCGGGCEYTNWSPRETRLPSVRMASAGPSQL